MVSIRRRTRVDYADSRSQRTSSQLQDRQAVLARGLGGRWSVSNRFACSAILGICYLFSSAFGSSQVEYVILFGFGDEKPTRWDGSIRANGARIERLEGWRLARNDRINGLQWVMSTRRVKLTRGSNVREADSPVLENGLYVLANLQDPQARFEVETLQGSFYFSATDILWGVAASFLNGRVKVEPVPWTEPVTDSLEEQNYPALASSGEKAYLAYVEFTHGDRSQVWPRQLREKPSSYEPLRRPAGGDQVLLKEFSAPSGRWSHAEAVSEAGQDVYGVAVAVDGEERVWVIWSAQIDGNFDLYARYRQETRWSHTIKLSRSSGPDLSPAAATDSEGAVWVVWQGFRDGLDILAVRQQGDRFSSEQRVSTSPASDWSPQITAGEKGEVAVVWDTYEKGDYDVYVRRLRDSGGISMQDTVPVAVTRRFEVRPSIAYDSGGRLWVAYEESYPSWGKDFGAYETTGTGLYQGNRVRLKVLGNNQSFRTADSLATVLEKLPASHPVNKRALRSRNLLTYPEQPEPELARNRRSRTTPYPRFYPSKSHPRLVIIPNGKAVLTYRNASGRVWGSLGTTWFENLVYYDGNRWHGPVFLAHSDGILDSRPALIGFGTAELLVVAATDHRFSRSGLVQGASERDFFNYDLMAYRLQLSGDAVPPDLKLLPPQVASAPNSDVLREREQHALMKRYRVTLDTTNGPETLRLLRGEFHRHTAISGDGGNDGDITDAWRYFIDAAAMEWAGCCDHDNGGGREFTWWLTQKMTDAFLLPGQFIPMFSHERSVRYPEGHRNVVFAQRGIRPLPRLPKTDEDSPPLPAPDTQMLYEYLRYFDGVAAVHTSGTGMGTDWRDNDPRVEPIVEIYQGDRQNYEMPGAPRTNTADDSIGNWRPLGFVANALAKGYRLGFQASSDHISTHMSYCNVWVTELSREAILEGLKRRRVYGATDNILADVRCSGHFMGEEFTLKQAPKINVKLIGTAPFKSVYIIKNGRYAYFAQPGEREVDFSWLDLTAEKNKTSYYYVRGEQVDGEIVWVSPMWITVE